MPIRHLAASFLFFFIFCHIVGDPKDSYVPLSSFLKTSRYLKFSWEPLNLTFEIRYKGRRVRMQIDSNFYIYKGRQTTISLPPIYTKDEIHLPTVLVGELRKRLGLRNSRSFVAARTRQEVKKPAPRKKPVTNKRSQPHNFKGESHRLDFIVIDPGHGGRDPGAKGHNRVLEKKITLTVSKRLRQVLRAKFPHTKIILTRKRDRFLSLERRSDLANRHYSENKFGIFLSLHCNATFSPRNHGFEIYYLDKNPTNEQVRLLMIRENLSSRDPRYVRKFTSYLVDAQVQKESKTLAQEIHRYFVSRLRGLVSSRGIRRADFSVIRGVSMPALLIEMGYITNAQEARVLQGKKFQRRISQAIAEGIRSFLKRRPGV